MPIPEFIVELRRFVGNHPLFLAGCSAVVLRERDGRTEVLLVRRADTGAWTPVTGIVDPGEETHHTAVREVAEEACVTAEVERLVWVGLTDRVVYPNGDVTQYIDHTFRCRWVSGEPAVGDDENTDARFFPVEQLPPMPDWHRARVECALANEPNVRLGRD